MNELLAEPPFPLARRLAAAVTLVALGVLWAPALPVSPMLALAGVCWCRPSRGMRQQCFLAFERLPNTTYLRTRGRWCKELNVAPH